MRVKIRKLMALLLALLALAGCAAPAATEEALWTDETVLAEADFAAEAVPLAAAPAALPAAWEPVATGYLEKRVKKAVIDYSNTADGYVMVQYTAETTKRLKAQVVGPTTTYTYNITAGQWETFPLSDGSGSYKVTVFENVKDSKYAAVVSVTTKVKLKDEFAPFLHSNQYVNFAAAPKTVEQAEKLVEGKETALEKVKAVYDFTVKKLTYDKKRAATVKSGYLPELDSVLAEKKGICFDYAALMTGMLRSQGVPCKLVVGYAGKSYHAWISVWSEESGWLDGAIYFDGSAWQRMDPTFASSGKQSASIMKYIGDGKNYTVKYLY